MSGRVATGIMKQSGAQRQPATIHEAIATQVRIKQQGYTVQGMPINMDILARRLIDALEKDWGESLPPRA
jgi:hypothetical protein